MKLWLARQSAPTNSLSHAILDAAIRVGGSCEFSITIVCKRDSVLNAPNMLRVLDLPMFAV